MANPDDERLGLALRAIRRRQDLTQARLADLAGVPRRVVMLIEAGAAGRIPLDQVRRVFAATGGRARITTWWHGAAADRLLDERHAGLVERAVALLRRRDWQVEVERTYSEYGERGSIDILGARPAQLAAAVCEVKSTVGSSEEMHRLLDAKARLAPALVRETFGFLPRVVGRILILPDDMTLRRWLDRHPTTMASLYPARGQEIRAWLRQPDRPLRGVWFLSEVRHADMPIPSR